MYAKNDEEQLELISSVVSRYDDLASPELRDFLDSYGTIGMMSRLIKSAEQKMYEEKRKYCEEKEK